MNEAKIYNLKTMPQIGFGNLELRARPPLKAIEDISGNMNNINLIDKAINAIGTNPEATGYIKGNTHPDILNRVDPNGISTRAMLADLSSMVVHDRSGAAVTVSEYPRLKPFLPMAPDNADTVRRKLITLKQKVEEENNLYKQTLSQYNYNSVEQPQQQQNPIVNKLKNAGYSDAEIQEYLEHKGQ
jgi:hypothetical protein